MGASQSSPASPASAPSPAAVQQLPASAAAPSAKASAATSTPTSINAASLATLSSTSSAASSSPPSRPRPQTVAVVLREPQTQAEEAELAQIQAKRDYCRQTRQLTLEGSKYTMSMAALGTFLSALAPDHWPLRTRGAPLILFGLIGVVCDTYRAHRDCTAAYPEPQWRIRGARVRDDVLQEQRKLGISTRAGEVATPQQMEMRAALASVVQQNERAETARLQALREERTGR